MRLSILIDYTTVARQILKVSDIRKSETFAGRSTSHSADFSREDYRYFTLTALITTAIGPQKAAAVTRRLLDALDKFEVETLTGLPPSVWKRRREVFVTEFLKYEYER